MLLNKNINLVLDQRLRRNQIHLSSIDFPIQLRLSDLLSFGLVEA